MTLVTSGGVHQLRIQRELVDVLARCQGLRAEGSRQMLVDLVSDAFRDVISLSAHAPREQLLELVRYCGKRPSGLHTLVEGISVLEPQAPEVPQLIELCDEWEAAKALPIDDWDKLREALQSVHLTGNDADELPHLRTLVRLATDGRVDLPSHCDSVWETFVYMAGANAAAESLPPAMIFLDCVAERTDPDMAAQFRGWNRQWAERFAVTDLLEEAPWRAANGPDSEPNLVYLVIQIDPDPTDRDIFAVSHWRQWSALGWQPHRLGDVAVHRSDLEKEVDRLISELETELGAAYQVAHAGTIFLEFIVPWEMLNTPVEFWRKWSMSQDTVPLAVDHPVVLRSLDRMRATRHRLAWKKRWSSLSGTSPANRHYWSQPSGSDYFTRLAAELGSDEQIVSLVLSEPPGDRDGVAWREAAMAFRAGIPAIIWDREDCTVGPFREAVATMLEDGAVAELPQRVANLRREALRINSGKRHPGQTIAILFDDPDRLPEPPSTWWGAQRT